MTKVENIFLLKIKKVNHIKELLRQPITAKYNIVCPRHRERVQHQHLLSV